VKWLKHDLEIISLAALHRIRITPRIHHMLVLDVLLPTGVIVAIGPHDDGLQLREHGRERLESETTMLGNEEDVVVDLDRVNHIDLTLLPVRVPDLESYRGGKVEGGERVCERGALVVQLPADTENVEWAAARRHVDRNDHVAV